MFCLPFHQGFCESNAQRTTKFLGKKRLVRSVEILGHLLYINISTEITLLLGQTGLSKQCRPRSDVAECGI